MTHATPTPITDLLKDRTKVVDLLKASEPIWSVNVFLQNPFISVTQAIQPYSTTTEDGPAAVSAATVSWDTPSRGPLSITLIQIISGNPEEGDLDYRVFKMDRTHTGPEIRTIIDLILTNSLPVLVRNEIYSPAK